MIWFHIIFLFISLNTLYFPQSFTQQNYSGHYFLNRACIFLLFLQTEFSPEVFIEVLDCDSFCARKQNRLVFIFYFVKSSQSLMGERHIEIISIKYEKLIEISSKKYLPTIHTHTSIYGFLLQMSRFRTNGTTSVKDCTVHQITHKCSLLLRITLPIDFIFPHFLSHTALYYSGLWTAGISPAMLLTPWIEGLAH